MYNTHPHISTHEVSMSAKMATSICDCKLPLIGSPLENGLGRWVSTMAVTNVWPLVATSLKPNHSLMHGHMALSDRTTAPRRTVTVWRSVCTSPPPRLSRLW